MKRVAYLLAITTLLILLSACTTKYDKHYDMGKWYFNKGLLSEAAIEFKAAAMADNSNFRAHYGLAVIYAKKGWYEYALEEAEIAFDLHPSDENYQLIQVIRNKKSLDTLGYLLYPDEE